MENHRQFCSFAINLHVYASTEGVVSSCLIIALGRPVDSTLIVFLNYSPADDDEREFRRENFHIFLPRRDFQSGARSASL